MEILQAYDYKILDWTHKPIENFMGKNREEEYKLGLGISQREPRDPEVCYFNVVVARTITNQTNGVVFNGQIQKTFAIRVKQEIPTVEFYFGLIERISKEYAELFHKKTHQTNLNNRKTPVPQIENLRPAIQKSIDDWKNQVGSGLN